MTTNNQFSTYEIEVKIQSKTNPIIYITKWYGGNTENEKKRQEGHEDAIRTETKMTSVDKLLAQHKNIDVSFNIIYHHHVYDEGCVDKIPRNLARRIEEQILIDNARLRAENDELFKVLNERDAVSKNPIIISNKVWKQKPYTCKCQFLKKGCDYTCSNNYKSQHEKYNLIHLEWLKNQPPPNNENDIEN